MAEPLELAIDTASPMASIALTQDDRLVAELTWDCGREHSRLLLPAIDSLLQRSDASKDDLSALFVCTGPGSYAGLRAGMSIAKGLAFALELPIVGVGRLETEAYALACAGAAVAALHRAGRAQFAWAAYTSQPEWREVSAPRLTAVDEILEALPRDAIVTGETDDELAAALTARGQRVVRGAATVRRAALLAELAQRRLERGDVDDPKTLVPLYLREPAIGPQR